MSCDGREEAMVLTESVIEAGCAAYARCRDPMSLLVIPWTSRRLGIAAAFEAMQIAIAKEKVSAPPHQSEPAQ